MSGEAQDDLAPSQTDGFKVGQKKTIDEYKQLDANDESLRRWKESLGLSSEPTISDPDDPRKVIILSLALEIEGRPDVVIDLSQENSLDELKNKPFIIKEGAVYAIKAKFKVQHQVISGLKYVQVVKRKGIRVSKEQEMLGSYGPNTQTTPSYEKRFRPDEAPSGMLARGSYTATSRFIDDDEVDHLTFDWTFEIKKTWE